MHPSRWSIVVVCAALSTAAVYAGAEQEAQRPTASQLDRTPLILMGRVQQVYSPRLFSIESHLAAERQVLVLVPENTQAPQAGHVVSVRGALRRLDEAEVGALAWSAIDQRTRTELGGRPIVVAQTVDSGDVAPRFSTWGPAQPFQGAHKQEIAVRPATLASLISEIAGSEVRVPYARVVGLIDTNAFLVDTANIHSEPPGQRDRVLVLLNGATLRVPAEAIVASTVTVVGVARTLLGAQAGGDVAWPRLDRDTIKRLDVRAAVVASSVRTADGVELTNRPQSQ